MSEPIVASDGLVAFGIPVPTPEPIIIPCELAVSDMTIPLGMAVSNEVLDCETESIVIIHG